MRRTVQVSFTAPEGQVVSGIKMLDVYPQNAVSLPAPPNLNARIGGRQNNSIYIPNLGDDGLTMTVSRPANLTQGNLYTISFDECVGAPRPPISEFSCTVEECGSSFGPVEGCECAISEPLP